MCDPGKTTRQKCVQSRTDHDQRRRRRAKACLHLSCGGVVLCTIRRPWPVSLGWPLALFQENRIRSLNDGKRYDTRDTSCFSTHIDHILFGNAAYLLLLRDDRDGSDPDEQHMHAMQCSTSSLSMVPRCIHIFGLQRVLRMVDEYS